MFNQTYRPAFGNGPTRWRSFSFPRFPTTRSKNTQVLEYCCAINPWAMVTVRKAS